MAGQTAEVVTKLLEIGSLASSNTKHDFNGE
jgi:hypothetical protein